jgi:hypothetical protein
MPMLLRIHEKNTSAALVGCSAGVFDTLLGWIGCNGGLEVLRHKLPT